MLTDIRDALYRAISTPRGNSLLALRIPKDLARRFNVALGSPLASRDELARRVQARARLAELRNQAPTLRQSPTLAAPVVVYFEKDRNVRELARIEALLGAREIRWSRLDVGGDEATFDFVIRAAKCERDDLPVVFVGDRAIGGFDALTQADVAGELVRMVRG